MAFPRITSFVALLPFPCVFSSLKQAPARRHASLPLLAVGNCRLEEERKHWEDGFCGSRGASYSLEVVCGLSVLNTFLRLLPESYRCVLICS